MTITAEIVADSIASNSRRRLTTFKLRYPWFIHPEFMTHRTFSRSAASSRAIPINTFIANIKRDTAMPVRWGLNGKGMQDAGVLDEESEKIAKQHWIDARDRAIEAVSKMLAMPKPPHKQIANRLLMPFAHIDVVATASTYTNFFALRRHNDAAPEIHALADAMWQALRSSTPTELQPGEWHLPFIQPFEREGVEAIADDAEREKAQTNLIKISVARSARVSYRGHNGKPTSLGEDVALYDRLLGGFPIHASPAEHQATPDTCNPSWNAVSGKAEMNWDHPELHGNLGGWIQHRKTLPNENITRYNPEN